MMRKVFVGLFMMLALSSFVFAADSEIVVDFNVDVPTGEVSEYVSPKSFVGDYLGYAVLAFVVLAFAYFAFKKKGFKKRTSKKKKVSRSKK